jgi:hypothetical protein
VTREVIADYVFVTRPLDPSCEDSATVELELPEPLTIRSVVYSTSVQLIEPMTFNDPDPSVTRGNLATSKARPELSTESRPRPPMIFVPVTLLANRSSPAPPTSKADAN